MMHTFVHSDVNAMMKSFRYDAHPMGMFCSTVAALSTLHP
jgi:citrate synthase